MQHSSEKMHFLGFLFPQVVQKHKLGEVGKKYILIVYFLGNTCAKNYHNWIMLVEIIASQRWDVFWDTVYIHLTAFFPEQPG